MSIRTHLDALSKIGFLLFHVCDGTSIPAYVHILEISKQTPLVDKNMSSFDQSRFNPEKDG